MPPPRHPVSRRTVVAALGGASLLSAASVAEAARAGAAGLSPWAFGARAGADNIAALDACAARCVAEGRPMLIDRDIAFAGTWRPPAGLILRSGFSDTQRLIHMGPGDGIEVTGAIDIDGLVVDGGETGFLTRVAGESAALLGIHGTMGASPAYLTGVRIGRLRVQNSGKIGFATGNLRGLSIDRIEARDIFCTCIVLSGLVDTKIGAIDARNIGDLQQTGSRRAGVLIAPEIKKIASWYAVTAMLPTQRMTIDTVTVTNNTDTAFYIHDQQNRVVSGIEVGSVQVSRCGKDGVKVRAGARDVHIAQASATDVAGVGLVIESAQGVSVDSVTVTGFGLDTMGMMKGAPAPFQQLKEVGRSISPGPNGILCTNSQTVSIASFSILHGHVSPVAGAEGHGLHINKCSGVNAAGRIGDIGGNAVRLAAISQFALRIAIDSLAMPGKPPVLFADDGVGPSSDGRLQLIAAPLATPDVVVTGACHDIAIALGAGAPRGAVKIAPAASAITVS